VIALISRLLCIAPIFISFQQEKSRGEKDLISLAEGIVTLRMILIASTVNAEEERSVLDKRKNSIYGSENIW